MEIDFASNLRQLKFKNKDLKHQVQDMKLSLKHTENRINQKDE
jgi:hypothetical protein